MSEHKEFDIVVFGASGFTGQYVVENLAKLTSTEEKQLSWAIAGRSKDKLKQVLANVTEHTGVDVNSVKIIEADVASTESLNTMCKQAKLILNCVGPYNYYGEPVVKACIENKTHHLDVSGEPKFLEQIQLDYNDKARESNVYVIGACGFDSIPCETGIQFIKQKFDGDLNSVETYLNIKSGPEGSCGNIGTWLSAINGFASGKDLRALRMKLFDKSKVPRSNHPLKSRGILFYNEDVKSYAVPFPVTDKSVVTRTMYHNFINRKARPFQILTYLNRSSWFTGVFTLLFGAFFGLMATFRFTRSLLEKYPSFFSFGHFTNTGPTRKQVEGASFEMVFVAEGYSEKLNDIDETHVEPPNKKIIASVSGPEIGYITTPICMVQAALAVLQETDKLPSEGGVFPPGAAFQDTKLLERLVKHGIVYSVRD